MPTPPPFTPSPAGDDDMVRRVLGERTVLLGWGRAVLLQVAHPLIAEGVASHSSFTSGPLAPFIRLRATIRAMLALVFGSDDEAGRAAAGINAIHDRVHGRLRESAGRFAAGTEYSAHDAPLLSWVHLTLIDSLLGAYERFVEPLASGERDRYCVQAARIEPRLGIPAGSLPRTAAEAKREFDRRLASDEIAVAPTARTIAETVLHPPPAILTAPVAWVHRDATIGTLPPDIRTAYGFTWSPADERRLRYTAAGFQRARRFTPRWVRQWPEARRAAS